jgi:hypothetical protein
MTEAPQLDPDQQGFRSRPLRPRRPVRRPVSASQQHDYFGFSDTEVVPAGRRQLHGRPEAQRGLKKALFQKKTQRDVTLSARLG